MMIMKPIYFFVLLAPFLMYNAFSEVHTIDLKRAEKVQEQSHHGKKGFLRALQQYGNPCNYNQYCNSTANGGSCIYCVNSFCTSTAPVCNSQCMNDDQCYSAPNSCTRCINSRCQRSSGINKCGYSCQNDAYCEDTHDSCYRCIGGTCQKDNNNNVNSQCNNPCNSDSGCSSSPGSCIYCVNNKCSSSNTNTNTNNNQCGISCQGDYQCPGQCFRCINSLCAQPQCGTYCSIDNNCVGAPNGCNYCNAGTCSTGDRGASNNGGTNSGSCITTYNDFTSAVTRNSNSITLCGNGNTLTLTQSVTINTKGDFTLQCQKGPCVIDGNSRYSVGITANKVTVNGITFQNCKSSLNGGALSITPTSSGSIIQSCIFNQNQAPAVSTHQFSRW